MDFLDSKYKAINPGGLISNMSYSGYKINDVKKKLEENIRKKNISEAIFWSAELHLSNQMILFLTVIKNYAFNTLNVLNYHFLYHLYTFQRYYFYVYSKAGRGFHHEMANDLKIRNFIGHIIPIICTMEMKKIEKLPKIKDSDLIVSNIKEHIRSRNLNNIGIFIKPGDTKELIIPLNEIINNILNEHNDAYQRNIYWLSWIFSVEKKYFKRHIPAFNRPMSNIEIKYVNDWIWLLMSILDYLGKKVIKKPELYEIYVLITKLYTQHWCPSQKTNPILIQWLFWILAYNKDIDVIETHSDIIKKANEYSLNINFVYYDVFNNTEGRTTFLSL